MHRPLAVLLFALALAAIAMPDRLAAQRSPGPGGFLFGEMVAIYGEKPVISLDPEKVRLLWALADRWEIGPAAPKDCSIELLVRPAESVPFDPECCTIASLSVRYTGESEPNRQQKDQYIAWARQRLQNVLSKVHEMNKAPRLNQLRRAQERQTLALAMANAARDRLEKTGDTGQRLIAQLGLVPAAFSGGLEVPLATFQEDWLTLRVEVAGLKARHEAIVKHIETRSEKLKSFQQQQQEVLSELAKIVELREKQVQAAIHGRGQGVVAVAEVDEAQVQLATARADLARQRQLIAQQAGSGQLDRLNEQLADVQIEMAAAEARLEVGEEVVGVIGHINVRELAIEYEGASRRLKNALAEQDAADAEAVQLRVDVEAVPPPRVVIISPDKPSK